MVYFLDALLKSSKSILADGEQKPLISMFRVFMCLVLCWSVQIIKHNLNSFSFVSRVTTVTKMFTLERMRITSRAKVISLLENIYFVVLVFLGLFNIKIKYNMASIKSYHIRFSMNIGITNSSVQDFILHFLKT